MNTEQRKRLLEQMPPPGLPSTIIRSPSPFSEHPTGWERVAMLVTYGVLSGFLIVVMLLVILVMVRA